MVDALTLAFVAVLIVLVFFAILARAFYQILPYQPLTEALARDVAARLGRMIAVLQPILAEADARARLGAGADGAEAPRLATRGRRGWRRR